jgi:hypothetical protein
MDKNRLTAALIAEHSSFAKEILSYTLHELNTTGFIGAYSAGQYTVILSYVYKYTTEQLEVKSRWMAYLHHYFHFKKFKNSSITSVPDLIGSVCKLQATYHDEGIYAELESRFSLLLNSLNKIDESVWDSRSLVHPIYGRLSIRDYLIEMIDYQKKCNQIRKK